MEQKRGVIDVYLTRDDANTPQLIIVFEDGEHVAQDIDEVSATGWLEEGLVYKLDH